MNKLPLRTLLCAVALLVASRGVVQASAISGSLPLVVFSATQNGANLQSSTTESAAQSLTSGPGLGDFSVIAIMTHFGSVALDNLTVASGGGFLTQTSNFLNVNLTGIFDPGPGIPGVSPSSAIVHLSFNQTGQSLSGSYTLATVPEPGALALLSSGLLACVTRLRRSRSV